MIRITTIFLCLLLAAAAAGRYRAEVAVREAREELRALEVSKAEEVRKIQILKAEVAYLENPERLTRIAEAKTDLRLAEMDQTLDAREFAAQIGADDVFADTRPSNEETIKHALAMADFRQDQ